MLPSAIDTKAMIAWMKKMVKKTTSLWNSSTYLRIVSVVTGSITVSLFARNLYFIQQRKYKQLPPGPTGIPFFGSLFSCIDTAKFASNLSLQFGSISMAYIGVQRFIFLHDINSINSVFTNKFALEREWDESLVVQHIKPHDLMSAFTPYKYWRPKRKIFQSVIMSKLDSTFVNKVHNKSLQHVFAAMDECIENNKSWIIMNDIKYIHFHFVWYALFGTFLPPGSEQEEKLIHLVENSLNEFHYDIVLRYLNIARFFPSQWLQLLFPTFKAFMAYLEHLLNTTLHYDNSVFDMNDEKWSEHFQQARADKNSCVAAKLIAEHRHNPIESSNKTSVLMEMLQFWIAGVDTSLHANEYGLVLLAKYPREQELIYKELFGVFGSDIKMEKNKLRDVVHKLHYFRAFIHEVLRLCNVTPLSVVHYNRHGSIKVDKYIIPKGTVIIADLQSANLNDEYWTKETNGNTKKLCLKAWLDNKNQFKVNVHKDKLMSFGAGPRNCAGKSLAMRGLYSIMGKLILSYKFEIADGNTDVKMKQKFQQAQFLCPEIPLKISRR